MFCRIISISTKLSEESDDKGGGDELLSEHNDMYFNMTYGQVWNICLYSFAFFLTTRFVKVSS